MNPASTDDLPRVSKKKVMVIETMTKLTMILLSRPKCLDIKAES